MLYFNYIFFAVAALFLGAGCHRKASSPVGSGSPSLVEVTHNKAVETGYETIDFASSIRSKYQAVSFIESFQNFSLPEKWLTVFYVNGRYEVVLEVPVSYNTQENIITPDIENSILRIFEISRVAANGGGAYHISYGSDQREMTISEIRDLEKAGWDFEGTGILPEEAKMPNLEDYIQSWGETYPDQKKWLRPRVKVR
jgi:hypothetical protein